jgi:hypothetical protein
LVQQKWENCHAKRGKAKEGPEESPDGQVGRAQRNREEMKLTKENRKRSREKGGVRFEKVFSHRIYAHEAKKM